MKKQYKYNVWASEKIYYGTREIVASSQQEAEEKYEKMIGDNIVNATDSSDFEVEAEIVK